MNVQHLAITSREQWLELRKPDITASTIGALFNCHPYTTPLKIYAEKRGTEFDTQDNKVMRRGRWLEPAVKKAVEELRPDWKLVEPNEYLRDPDYRSSELPRIFTSWATRAAKASCRPRPLRRPSTRVTGLAATKYHCG